MKLYQGDYKTPLSELSLPNRIDVALARNKEGRPVTSFFPGSEGKLFLIHSPELIRTVLGRLHETFVEEKHPFAGLNALYTPSGREALLLGGGQGVSPVESIAPALSKYLPELRVADEALDVFPVFSRLVLEIMGHALFGFSMGDLADRFFRASMKHEDSLARGRGKPGPGTEKEQLRASIERELLEQESVAAEIIAIRKGEGVAIPELPPGIPIHRAIVRTLLNAYAGTATTLSWAVLQLARFPDRQMQLRKALSSAHSNADFVNSVELENFLKETLRLFPTAWMMSRLCLKETKLGDLIVPARASVLICTYSLHHDSNLWTDPELFCPERFSKGQFGGAPPYSYLPFGAGPHRCVAMRFAMETLQVLLGSLLCQFEFSEVPGLKIVPFPRVALQPEPGAWVKIRPRLG